MDEPEFDDARLDDAPSLERSDAALRELALTGARLRIEAAGAAVLPAPPMPRGVVMVGEESRLVRAVIETTCPVPMLVWGYAGLPGWAGPLDLVVVQANGTDPASLLGTITEAVRRGCYLVVTAPDSSAVALAAASSSTLLIPTRTGDPLAGVIVVLQVLKAAGLGPEVVLESVARHADLVAEECSPHRDLAHNPAKAIAMALADAQPLLWGGSVLAARAARRVAEALRRGSGRPALAASAEELLPVLLAAPPVDLFDDPDEARMRPAVVAFRDGAGEDATGVDQPSLVRACQARGLRWTAIEGADSKAGPVESYVSLLMQGRFAACYLGVGLGLPQEPSPGLWSPGH